MHRVTSRRAFRFRTHLTLAIALLGWMLLAPQRAGAIVYYSLNFKPYTTNTNLWISCFDTYGNPIGNAQYTTTMSWVSNSNSHMHPDTPGHPVSSVWPAQGTVAANGSTAVTLYTTLIGQDEYVTINCSAPGYTTRPSINLFTVGYADIYYNNHPDRMINVGATAAHGGTDYNRYMTTDAAYSIYNTVGDYLTAYGLTGQQVAANDQSLPYGGIFDLKSDWWYPHDYHYRGTAADIRGNTNSNTVPTSRQSTFIDYCRIRGAELYQIEYANPEDTDIYVKDPNRHIHCHWALIP